MTSTEEKEFPTLEDMSGEELDEFMRTVRLSRIARPEKAKAKAEPKEKAPRAKPAPKVKVPRAPLTVERIMELMDCTAEEAQQVFDDAKKEAEDG